MTHVEMSLSQDTQNLLCCPACKTGLKHEDNYLVCTSSGCSRRFPIVDGVPVLINDDNSLFSVEDFAQHRDTFFRDSKASGFKAAIRNLVVKMTPDISANIKGRENYARFAQLLLKKSKSPRVLILGGSIQGRCMEPLLERGEIELVDSDVAFGPRTKLVCDAHDIPFADKSFDGVVAQAVLEHVADPYRCVDEIHRVLKDDGLVYAETPFMQQMHGAPYDYTRFSIQGYRRLFRRYEEIDCGTCTGPGMALAWAYRYFLLSFTRQGARLAVNFFVGLTAWYLKYFDRILVNKPAAVDGASGYHFLGKKSSKTATDREIMKRYYEKQGR